MPDLTGIIDPGYNSLTFAGEMSVPFGWWIT